ncbi:hypothetical protein JCM10212_005974 [Sporobolomyces blumeae]
MIEASTSRHTLDDDPSRGTRSIQIRDWTIRSTKLPILTIPEADAASAELDLALPEIIFGNNRLEVSHDPSGFKLEWNALDMLRAVKKGPGWDADPASGAVRVAHADEWTRGQASTGSISHMTVQKPFDWTYTTVHPGSTSTPAQGPMTPWDAAPPSHPGIPLALLARTDIPILFFDEIPLFEDELGDNGIADVTVRVRVNSTSFYVLSRFSLRIDHVLFRHFDVRLYHEFGSNEIVRERKGLEATYEEVKRRLLGVPTSLAPDSSSSSSSSANAGRHVGSSSTAPRVTSPFSGVSLPVRSPLSAASSFRPPTRSPMRDYTPPGRSPANPSSSASAPSGRPFNAAGTASGLAIASGQGEDLTKLNDINWVSQTLQQIDLQRRMEKTSLGERDEQSKGEWEGTGRKLEVLSLNR